MRGSVSGTTHTQITPEDGSTSSIIFISISYIYTSKSKNILLIIHYVKLYNTFIKKSNLYVYMLFLVYLSIEESTSGVPEYNRERKRSEVPAKQKSSLAGSLLLYLYSCVYCLLQLF